MFKLATFETSDHDESPYAVVRTWESVPNHVHSFTASGVCHAPGCRRIPEWLYDGVPLASLLTILRRQLSHHRHQDLTWIRDLEKAAENVAFSALSLALCLAAARQFPTSTQTRTT